MRALRPTLATVLLGLALSPLAIEAQGTGRTHTVKPGDTLWDLAQTYLGDPFKWPEIYRRNTGTVADPHWIYPDQVLVVDGDVMPTPGTPPDEAAPVAQMPDTTAPMPTPMPDAEPPAMTIFNPERYRVVRGERTSLLLRSAPAAVRSGDFMQAPFLWDANGVQGAGRIETSSEAAGVRVDLTERPIQLFETVIVRPPQGAQGLKDERYLVFRYGPTIENEGRVVVPTGIVRLSADAADGVARGVLLNKFEDVFETHGLMPLDTLVIAEGATPQHVEFGLETRVAYVYSDPVLPPVGHQLILAAGASDGLVPGDQLTLLRPRAARETGASLAPQRIAVAQVVRVTQWGASAIIISQSDGGVGAGTTAVVTGKMP
ncbi:MAG: LysM peptidoglycan-binding domain-containing protein [Gemmatimonadaceae bacterium]|nr:LysM peptidoglycan-binding domain-containing protein [Gemmatimonadaceae bacterium]